MRLLVAARLSQQGDHNNRIENDDRASITFAEQNGHTIVFVAADFKSGTVQPWNRPNLKPWVTIPEKIAQYDGILASSLDRLSRGDKESTTEIEKWARDNGKVLLTIDGLQFPSEGNEGIRWDITARIAHQEWLNTSKRYRDIQAGLRAKGSLVGRAAFGFDIVPDVNDKGQAIKTLRVNKTQAAVVRKMVAMYLDGTSMVQICIWLESEGIKPNFGASWRPATISQLLRNEALIGRRRSETTGKIILRHDALLDMDTWNKLQAKLDAKAAHKGTAPKQTAMLTSVALCSKCGGPMYKLTAGRNASRREYFRCHGTDRAPSTCRVMVRMDELEEHVNNLFMKTALGTEPEMSTVVIPAEGYGEEIAEVEDTIRDLDLDDDEYDAKLSALRSERKRLKNLQPKAAAVKSKPTGRNLSQVWKSLDDAGKRAWLLEGQWYVMVTKPVSESWIGSKIQDEAGEVSITTSQNRHVEGSYT